MKFIINSIGFTVALSLAIHFFILLSVTKITAPPQIKQNKEYIEFNVVEESNPQHKTRTGRGQKPKSKNKAVKSNGSINLSKLKPSNHSSQIATSENFQATIGKKQSGGYTDGSYQKFSETEGAFGVMNTMGAAEYGKNIWFYQQLWTKLNFHSSYLEDLAKQRIKGAVNVHALVNHKGQLIDVLEITGPENLLKAYVMVNLIHTLKDPLSKKNWLKGRKKIPLLITYEFILHELAGNKYHNPDTSDQGNHLKNTFVIKKHRIINNRITQYYAENIAPFIPPIMPVPGGVIIDFVAAYHIYDTWGEPRASVRRKRRLKSLKKMLSHTIKKHPPGHKTKKVPW